MSKIFLSEIFFYIAFLAFIMIEEPFLVVAYIVVLAAAAVDLKRKKQQQLAALEKL